MNEFRNAWREALEELMYVNSSWGSLARSLGEPIPGYENSTAWVSLSDDRKTISFHINPDFLETLEVESAAAVIFHETYHVFRGDLYDTTNKKRYPDASALVSAQECTINDCIESYFKLPLPDFVMRGEDSAGVNMASMTVDEAYALFENKKEEKQNKDQEDSESGDSSNGGTGSSDSSGSGGNSSPEDFDTNGGKCHGFQMPEDMTPSEISDVVKTIQGMFDQAAENNGMTSEELESEISGTGNKTYSPTGVGGEVAQQLSSARMNWRNLLAEINPKILHTGGRKRTKLENNWVSYNRRMGAVYPRVILPKIQPAKPKPGKGDDKATPTFVIALDLSGSIDRGLVKMLQGLLKDIPSDLIDAHPCTWSSTLLPFTEDGKVVASSGTNIHLVSKYVEKVKKETGTEPYVLVITDGEFTSNFPRPGNTWFWMGVDRHSMQTLKGGSYYTNRRPIVQEHKGEKAYFVGDFKE